MVANDGVIFLWHFSKVSINDLFFLIGTDMDISDVTVPISALVNPLCVIPDYGGHQTSYIIVLPKRNWSRYFGDKIQSEYNKSLEE